MIHIPGNYPAGVRIHILQTNDITHDVVDRLNELMESLFENRYVISHDMRYYTETALAQGSYPLVAYLETAIVGAAFLHAVQTYSRYTLTYDDLIIDPAFRGKGISHAIDQAIISLAKSLKVDCVECVVNPDNAATLHLHTKTGYSSRPVQKMVYILKTWEKKA